MHRRQFLQQALALGVSAAFPLSGLVLGAANAMAQPVNIKDMFNRALANNPDLIGLANTLSDYAPQTLSVEGRWPVDLQGVFLRNGPAKHERGEDRYSHWFEGDGMVQRFDMRDGNITHTGRFVRTPKFTEEEQAGQYLYSGPNTPFKQSKAVSSPDRVNVANTNVIMVNDELWTLWEAGSATAVDPDTMDFKRHVDLGEGTQFAGQLKGLPFSAHPKIEANGDIWNFGLSPRGQIVLYHLSAKGTLKNVSMLNPGYRGGMLHDFLITHRHILIILPSIQRDFSRQGYFSSIQYADQQPMRVLVADKDSLSLVREFELDAGFAFHFGNAWEDEAGTIRFDASLYDNLDVLHEKADLMQGKTVSSPSNAYTTVFTLYANGKTIVARFPEVSEFPRVFSGQTGLKNDWLFHVSGDPQNLWAHRIVARNLQSDSASSFDYGEEFLVEEHIPISPDGKNEAGYLLGTALHVPSKRTCLNVFCADRICDGPVARAWLPYHLPLGFHGNFVSQV